MRTTTTRALALLAALSALLGFVPSAGAQAITTTPATVTARLEGSPSFRVAYQSATFSSACSVEGKFNTELDHAAAVTLGVIGRAVTLTPAEAFSTAEELVSVPAGVIDEIRRRRITRPVYYSREWVDCESGASLAFTDLPITFTSTSSVEATPVTARVAMGTDTLVPVRWKLQLGSGVSARVESREGRFVDGRDRIYGSPVIDLLQTSGRSQAEVGETLRVPGSVVREILRARGESGMRFERTFLVDGAPVVGTLLLQPANAIQTLGPRPAQVGVMPQSAGSVGVRWDATLLPGVTGPAGASLSLASSEGVFRSPEGRILGRVSTTISQPAPAAVATALSARAVGAGVVVSEQLVIPHAVIDAALETGFTWFTLQRTFRVGEDSAAGELRLDFAGRVAATFGIDRAELRFLDGSRFKTVPPGEAVQVAADITFRGSGQLRGSWDLAGPTTTPGAAVFVRTELVNEYLSFGRRTLIRSPAVKAVQPGLYIVRLTLTEPKLDERQILELSFVVRATGEALEISLGQPPALARLAAGTLFEWQAVAGAPNYLLEIYDVPTAEGREPAAGMMLPGGASRATLSPATQRNLQPGRSYWWRVVALGPDGVLLGQSPLRELLTPQE